MFGSRIYPQNTAGEGYNHVCFYFIDGDLETQRYLVSLPGFLSQVRVVGLDGPRVLGTYLVLVHHLYEEGEGEADLCQLSDGHAVLGAVELWGIVIDVNHQNVECGGDGGIGRGAVVIQLCTLQIEDKQPRVQAAIIAIMYQGFLNARHSAFCELSHLVLTTTPGGRIYH